MNDFFLFNGQSGMNIFKHSSLIFFNEVKNVSTCRVFYSDVIARRDVVPITSVSHKKLTANRSVSYVNIRVPFRIESGAKVSI